MADPVVGVVRAVLDFGDGSDSRLWEMGEEEVEETGSLWVDWDYGAGELITGQVVLYTLDRRRLVEMFDAARSGESDEDLLLALDAAALAPPSDGG